MTHLSHLFMHATDLAAARHFYVEQLGLELLDEGEYIRVGGGDGFTIGMEEVPEAVGAAGIEVNIAVDDVDGEYRRLSEAGVQFEGPPADQPWRARHAWLRDPSGYRLSIYSPIRASDGDGQ